jgi:hypothetical protein
MQSLFIKTPFGSKCVVRRVGAAFQYYQTTPTTAAPNGEWWVKDLNGVFMPVASNSRALVDALQTAEEF